VIKCKPGFGTLAGMKSSARAKMVEYPIWAAFLHTTARVAQQLAHFSTAVKKQNDQRTNRISLVGSSQEVIGISW